MKVGWYVVMTVAAMASVGGSKPGNVGCREVDAGKTVHLEVDEARHG